MAHFFHCHYVLFPYPRMIKNILSAFFSILLVNNAGLFGQLQPGFQPDEARDMIMLCNTHTFIDLYGSDEKMIPGGYTRIYSSVATPLDTKFEVFRKGNVGVIEFRGSTASMMSWMVNVHSSMIPAEGRMVINGNRFDYEFAEDTSAAVHAGFALVIGTIAEEVLGQLKELHKLGVSNVIITGHSQGGALAHLMRAYLEHLPRRKLPTHMEFKTYSFAAPMVGDRAFATEYEREYCTRLSSFSIIEPEDPVPDMPIAYSEGNAFSMQNILAMMTGGQSIKNNAKNALLNLFSGGMEKITGAADVSIAKRVEGAVGEVVMPDYRKEWNYYPMATKIELDVFEYPKVLVEPKPGNETVEDGSSTPSKPEYKKEPSFFHYKP